MQKEAARRMGISASHLSALENLAYKPGCRPWNENRCVWTPLGRKVADFYGRDPAYLWPEEIGAVRKRVMTLELSSREVCAVLETRIEARDLLEKIAGLSRAVDIRDTRLLAQHYFEELDAKTAGQAWGLSATRQQQLLRSAERHFRDGKRLLQEEEDTREFLRNEALFKQYAYLAYEDEASGMTPPTCPAESEKAG